MLSKKSNGHLTLNVLAIEMKKYRLNKYLEVNLIRTGSELGICCKRKGRHKNLDEC